MNLLLIDTSNQPMSIALMNDDEVLAIKQQIVKIIRANLCLVFNPYLMNRI